MNFLYWKLLFVIIGVMSLLVWVLLIFNMLEMVIFQGWGFCLGEVFFEFVCVFKQLVVFMGVLVLLFSNLLIIIWVVFFLVILIDDGGMLCGVYVWIQVFVFGGVIIVSIIVVCFIKDLIFFCFIWCIILIQLIGLLVLLVGNIVWFYIWWWFVLGISFYVFGIGLLFFVLFCFVFFFYFLLKGMVLVIINIVVFSFMVVLVEVVCWVYFQVGGRIVFYCLVLIVGIVVIMLVLCLLKFCQ